VPNDCTAAQCVAGTCCTLGANRDGDSFDDCTEYSDGNPFTNPDIFNGLLGSVYAPCSSGAASCSDQDTLAKIRACTSGAQLEQVAQYGGFSWPSVSSSDICDGSHGFAPNFTKSCGMDAWAIDYTGQVALSSPGRYCFAMVSEAIDSSCGSIVLNGDGPSPLVTTQGATPICVSSAAPSAARLEIYYQQAAIGSSSGPYGLDVVWCFDASGKDCDPTASGNPLIPQMLRTP
jgi:hypothetical protein